MLFYLLAIMDSEAAKTRFVEHKKNLEDELDQQNHVREKLDLELAANRELRDSLRLGIVALRNCLLSYSSQWLDYNRQ